MGFRIVESKFALLFVNIAPDWLAPQAYQRCLRVFDAFPKYYANEGRESGSALVKARYHAVETNGIPLE